MMRVGFAYYPEHWPRSRWKRDAGLMKRGGFNVVRMAEFAWAFMEPEEGRYTFDWLDEALDILGKHGISAILCTPTAVMPAWCAAKYPETLATQANGQRIVWGVRKNNCFTSGTYRLLSERITRAMAEHFRNASNVIGWQTDNEFGGPACYCATCRSEFRGWLRRKYGSLDRLNRALGTHFWGHIYTDWDQIQAPVDEGGHNPSLCLEWCRFNSWLNVRFQRDQVRILREVCPRHFVTHNFMGLYNNLNYYELAEDLDHVSWDNYPVWGKPEVPYGAAAAADVMRGLKRRNFWIMEQTAGPGGWGTFGRNPRPGEIRKIAYQQVGHGAESIIWFRWRTCTAGREQYWHGILGHDGRPLRRYREASKTARELRALGDLLSGTTVRTPVAFIYDYESQWALRIQPAFPENNPHQAMFRYYNALFRLGIQTDMISPARDLAEYRVVVAPDLYLLPDSLARRLCEFVRKGGVLLTDCRTGVKDETGLCHPRTLPGLLRSCLGIEIQEYETLAKDMEYSVEGKEELAGSYAAVHYADWVIPRGAELLARYTDSHMKKYAAVTRYRCGRGWGYYVGAVIREDGFYDALMAEILRSAHIKPFLSPPAGVEVCMREGAAKRLLFLINHAEEPRLVSLPCKAHDALSRRQVSGEIELEPFGIAVLRV